MTARILTDLEIADVVVRAIGEEHVRLVTVGPSGVHVVVATNQTDRLVRDLDLTWERNVETKSGVVGAWSGEFYGHPFGIQAGPRDPLAYCQHETHPGSRYVDPEPPTLCGEDVIPGTDYCTAHLGLHDPDLAESILDDDEDDVVAYLNGVTG